MAAIKGTPTAKDLPRPNRTPGGGSFTEVEVPGDYEVKLEAYTSYDKTSEGKTKGWIFTYSCEYAPGKSVDFDLYLAHSGNALWKIVEAFDAHGSPSEDGVERTYDPDEIVGSLAAAHVDFPRDKAGQPTSTYRGIERLFPLPDDSEIQELVPEEADTPQPVEIPSVTDEAEEPEIL
jgi:hypothetical protein